MRWGVSWMEKRERYRRMGDDEWKVWFAWYPVRLSDMTWVWWETIEYNQPMSFYSTDYRLQCTKSAL